MLKAGIERDKIDDLPTTVLYDLWSRHCEKGQILSGKPRKEKEAVKPSVPSVSQLHPDLEELRRLWCLRRPLDSGWGQGSRAQVRATPGVSLGDLRPHVPITLWWRGGNIQRELPLVDAHAEASLIHGNPDGVTGERVSIQGYGGAVTPAVALLLNC